jgi:DNA-binding CsgD family transcriptional regulator
MAKRQNGAVLTQERLIGRDAELAAIRAVVASASRDGGALLLQGDAGIGKSALLEEGVEAAKTAGIRVLRVTGVRTEAHLPFAGLHQLLRPLLARLDALPPPQRSALATAFGLEEGAAQDPFLISLATLTLLTDAAADRPILAVVDDAQWLDRPSDEVLGFVARRLGSDPVALLVACRDGEATTAIESAGLPILQIQPLQDAAARELLLRRAAQLRTTNRERVLREAAGNPLALAELSAALKNRTGDAPTDPLPVTARIERSFASRLVDLPEATATLLLLTALDDQAIVDDILAAGRALGFEEVGLDDLGPAIDGGLLAIDERSLRFPHPLIRSAMAQSAGDADRRAAHAALAGVLADPDRVAWHRAAAATGPSEETAALLEAAPERSERRGAMAVAVTTLEEAARLTPDGEARGRRLLGAAERAYALGRYDIMLRVLEAADRLDVAALEHRRQAWLLGLQLTGPKTAREEQTIRLAVDAARRFAAEDLPLAHALLTLAAARSWWMNVSPDIWASVVDRATTIAQGPDDSRLLWVKSAAAPRHGAEVVDHLRRRLSSAEPLDPNDARVLGTCAMWVGDLDAATEFLGASLDVNRREGRLGLLARALIIDGWCSAHLGRLSDAAPELEEGLRLSVETDQENFVATAQVALTEYHALRGDLEQSAAALVEAERHARQAYADGLVAHVHHARGLFELAAGRHADAFDSLRHIYEPSHEGSHPVIGSWAISDLVESAVPAGHAAEAARYLDGLEQHPGLVASPWQRITMAYARAVLAASSDDDAAAEAAFAAALAMDLQRWPLPRARLLLAHGAWLRRQRRVAAARDPLRTARDLFDAIGVPWLADRARRELGATGEVSRARREKSIDELTPQELQIARLAASGLSNREIGERLYVSHRTVGFHLYHVYPKLGISGRAQLHAALGAA